MKRKNDISININFELKKRNAETGELIERIEEHNLVTEKGLNNLRDYLAGEATDAEPSHFAIGTGTTDETLSDTQLENEVFRDIFTETINQNIGEVKWKYYLASGDANTNDISEAGLFNDESAGDMFARVTFEPDTKTEDEAWTFTWTLNISNA